MTKTVKILTCLVAITAFFGVQTAKAQTQPRGFVYQTNAFTLYFGDKKFTVDAATLRGFQGTTYWPTVSPLHPEPLDLKTSVMGFYGLPTSPTPAFRSYHYQLDKIYDYIANLSPEINQPAQEPVLIIDNGRATSFTPPQNGLMLDAYQTTLTIAEALEQNLNRSELQVHETKPGAALENTNTFGIKELIAQGTSGFAGSPNNRRHNIAVGIEKMKGIIVAPGEEFSFNKYLGEVDGEHGFLPELVIKRTGTVPEFGGGLCQVSSTTFRAAMNAGLPITERRNHAYAVQYYAPQGTDATIYPGVVDLKFTNDTPGHILIWPYLKDRNTLIFDFYGTKDGRQVTLDKPIQWDRKPDGSMKASWTRVVIKDGETSTSTFKSTYLPPALFHKTEEFAKPTTTPVTQNTTSIQ